MGVRSKIPRVKLSDPKRQIRCARCGGAKLLPLTVHSPRAEYRQMQRAVRPVRAELKCVVCGHRHVTRPSVLLAG